MRGADNCFLLVCVEERVRQPASLPPCTAAAATDATLALGTGAAYFMTPAAS